MKIYKIAIGTTYQQKINHFQDVLDELGIKAEMFPVKVESGAAEQPATLKETKKGAVNRSKRAIEKVERADFGVGIEVGYQKNTDGDFEMLCVTAISDINHSTYAVSGRLLLPKYHQKILKDGKYLGDYVAKFSEKAKTPEERHIGDLIRHRTDFIKNSAKFALLQYLNKGILNLTVQYPPQVGSE